MRNPDEYTTKNLVTLADAAAHYKVNPRTLRRRIADGTLGHYRVGNRIRIDLTEADAIFRSVLTEGD